MDVEADQIKTRSSPILYQTKVDFIFLLFNRGQILPQILAEADGITILNRRAKKSWHCAIFHKMSIIFPFSIIRFSQQANGTSVASSVSFFLFTPVIH